jgi:hypothetical protein
MLQQPTEGAAFLGEQVGPRTSAYRFLSHEPGLGQVAQPTGSFEAQVTTARQAVLALNPPTPRRVRERDPRWR